MSKYAQEFIYQSSVILIHELIILQWYLGIKAVNLGIKSLNVCLAVQRIALIMYYDNVYHHKTF